MHSCHLEKKLVCCVWLLGCVYLRVCPLDDCVYVCLSLAISVCVSACVSPYAGVVCQSYLQWMFVHCMSVCVSGSVSLSICLCESPSVYEAL